MRRVVVTGLGVYRFDDSGEMYLANLHPHVTVDEVRDNTSWDIKISGELEESPPPDDHELSLIRERLDPEGIYTKGK
jgi:glutaconate CoA-transferase, subunit B